jgi:hypothetical protein
MCCRRFIALVKRQVAVSRLRQLEELVTGHDAVHSKLMEDGIIKRASAQPPKRLQVHVHGDAAARAGPHLPPLPCLAHDDLKLPASLGRS